MTFIQKPSPNQSPRKEGSVVSAIILHADAGKTEQGTITHIQTKHADPKKNVSYHYLIGRDGRVFQFVDEDRKAWHAGISELDGVPDCNQFSIGVSFANDQLGEHFTPAQIDTGVDLVADICRRRGIKVSRIAEHSQVSPNRKVDPGPLFPLVEFLHRVMATLEDAT